MVPASALRPGAALPSRRVVVCANVGPAQDQAWRRREPPARLSFTSSVGRVLRQDAEFIAEAAKAVKRAAVPLFWLRFLEDERVAAQWSPLPWPTPSYPGLSGMDLLVAEFEAIRAYANYVRHVFRGFSVPLPETYEQEMVEHYFRCRPHVLAVRILEVLFSFGTAAIQMKLPKSRTGNFFGEEDDDADASQYFVGELLKKSMLNLGPTFIKVGQTLSTRPDLIGSGMAKALSDLNDRVPPFPRSVAMKIIEDELGCSLDHAFSYISDETIAAASFGQVYRGCTTDGKAVAIKVQRPDLLHPVHLDIYILRLGLGILQNIAKRKSDPRLYADELGKGFVGELDYRLEASNSIEFKEAHAEYSFIAVPKVYQNLTRKKVLTMEWLEGDSPRDLLSMSKTSGRGRTDEIMKKDARRRVLDLVNKGVEATLIQLLDTGVLHADPHSGNLRYTLDGRLGFLDFGLLSRMENRHKTAMLAAIVHIANGDWGALVQDLIEMDVVPPNANTRSVTMDLEDALGVITFNEGIPDIKLSKVLGKIFAVAFQYNFKMPPYFVLVLRSLASLEGLAVASNQEFRSFQAAYPYVAQKLLYSNSSVTRGILYSVIFNKRREFQWKRIALFLKLSSSRLNREGILKTDTSPSNIQQSDNTFDIPLLILKLVTSKDGLVFRRILMDGDTSSLARAAISHEAIIVRQQMSRALADVIYCWAVSAMTRAMRLDNEGQLISELRDTPSESLSVFLAATVRDRRMKVIVSRWIGDIRQRRILALQLCWAVITVCFSSSALAMSRVLAWFLPKARTWLNAWYKQLAGRLQYLHEKIGNGHKFIKPVH